jgi:hypothetical protein
MGTTSKVCSVVLRFCELASAAIVVGILGRYLTILADANVDAGSRIIYGEVIGGISLFFSIVLFPPLMYSFYCFAIDFSLFVCWIVAFALLCNLTGSRGCDAYWYWNSWGYYWGKYWYTVPLNSITQSIVGTAGCAQWRTTLAFSFIGGGCWFFSACLGIYVCTKYPKKVSLDGEKGHVSVTSRFARFARKHKHGTTGVLTKENPEITADPLGNQT